MHFCINL